jgi:hypothetical protein
MAAEARVILFFWGFARVFAKRDQPTDTLTSAGGNMIASRAVTTLASPLLSFAARIEKKDLSHHSLGKFLKLLGVAGLADFVTDVGRRRRLRFFRGRRPG